MLAETPIIPTIVDVNHHYAAAHTTASPDFKVHSDPSCDEMTEGVLIQSASVQFVPQIRSGSSCNIGQRQTMEDEHICIDDLAAHMGDSFICDLPGSLYAVFDGHRGPEVAIFMKDNAVRLFIEGCNMPETADVDGLVELKDSLCRAFLSADLVLANECCASLMSGTTANTVLVLGNCLLVANAGDCRAVLSRKGAAVDLSNDHNTSSLPERQRVEELGAFIDDIYLNDISVTRALGNWDMKIPGGTVSALIAEPDLQQVTLTEDDEFLIIACDGVWEKMTSQNAVSLVRRGLRSHNNPQQAATELVTQALLHKPCDNLTVIVICFSSQICNNS